jgi:multiple sugar transport system permease protein
VTGQREPLRLGVLLAHALLLAGAAVFLLPFLWMVLTSFKPEVDFFDARLRLIPSAFVGFEHYRKALTDVPLLRFMLNGALVCGCIVCLQVLIGLPCGYALAKLHFPGRAGLFVCVMAGIVVPIQVPAIPLYLGFARVGLLDSYAALIVPYAVSAFGIFLFRQFFRTVPDEVIHAARLDGCNELSIVWRIMLPAAWPAVGAFAIISIVTHWNDLYWPLVAIITPDLAPPALGVMYFRSQEMATSEYGALLAGGTMITAPLIVAFLIARRGFMRGITMTGPV